MKRENRKEKLKDKVFKMVEHNWPTHIKELVKSLSFELNNSSIKKVAYHVKHLERNEKVRTKRIGKALIVWPYEIEKLRVIYEILKDE